MRFAESWTRMTRPPNGTPEGDSTVDASNISIGTILKCYFPYDEAPQEPGHKPHYCLAVEAPFEYRGGIYVVVAYSTSRIGEDLVQAHHGNALLTVSSEFTTGDPMPNGLGHFVLDRLAVLPLTNKWFVPFRAQFTFVTEEQCRGDAKRLEMFERFVFAKRVMFACAKDVLQHFVATNQVGLAPKQQQR